ncbi:hypothetical protein M426DRAFT_16914 [Hypoxylon sp. CI-4A]|nr:hypothetical protein M426DRAFT_16914 [Hypoxylon sp. CI-4A]
MPYYHLPELLYGASFPNNETWGFIIYRTTYDDQALWERYLAYVKKAMRASLAPRDPFAYGQAACMKLRLKFELQTKENKEDLEGKSILELREEFGRWVTTIPKDEKRGISKPRYDYFLYVDKEVLDRFQRLESARGDREPNFITEEVVAIVVEAHRINWEEDRSDDGGDDDNMWERWQYIKPYSIPELYDDVLRGSELWYKFFVFAPNIHGMPLWY